MNYAAYSGNKIWKIEIDVGTSVRHLQISVDPSNPISEMLFWKPVEYHKLKRKSGIDFVKIRSFHAFARTDEKRKIYKESIGLLTYQNIGLAGQTGELVSKKRETMRDN